MFWGFPFFFRIPKFSTVMKTTAPPVWPSRPPSLLPWRPASYGRGNCSYRRRSSSSKRRTSCCTAPGAMHTPSPDQSQPTHLWNPPRPSHRYLPPSPCVKHFFQNITWRAWVFH